MSDKPTSDKPASDDLNKVREKLLSSRKSRKAVIAVGGAAVRLINNVASYRRYIDRSNNIAPFKRLHFSNEKICCAACSWRPPSFLTDRHKRTLLTVHHLLPVADGGLDDDCNRLLNNNSEEWQRQYNTWKTRQKKNAV